MKTPVAALVLTAAALCAGSALAQTRPQAPAPRAAVPAPPPAVGTVPAGQGQGQTRGTGGDGSNRDHLDQDAQSDVRGGARFPTNNGANPVNGVGGTGGGRLAAPGGGGGPVAAEAIINTSRSNIKRPSSLAQGAGAADGGATPIPAPVTPR